MIRVLLSATVCASVMSLKLALLQEQDGVRVPDYKARGGPDGCWFHPRNPDAKGIEVDNYDECVMNCQSAFDALCMHTDVNDVAWCACALTAWPFQSKPGYIAYSYPVVKAAEDPHMCNIHRQHFDLNAVGEHLLLQVPKGSPALAAVFQVNASIVNVGGPCQAWIDGLTISGAPFGLSPLSFHTRQGSFNTDDSIFARTGSGKRTLKEIASLFASSGGPIQVKLHSTGNLMQPTQDFQRVELRTLQITLQPSRVQFAVTWATSLIAGKAINYLDFASSGLHVYPDALIGGLLGDDPHAELQVNCEKPALFSASPSNMARFGSRARADK